MAQVNTRDMLLALQLQENLIPQSVRGCNVSTPNHKETSPQKRKERRYKVEAEANFEGCESCTMVFTETRLHQDLTLFVSWKDFLTYALTGVWCQGKTRTGACVFITNNCWRQYTLHETVRKLNIKLVCLSLRPFYLPWKFGNIIPNPTATLRATVFIWGDFNHLTQVFNCMLNLRPDRRKYWLNVVKWTMFAEAKPKLLCPLLWNCSQ